LSVAIGLAEKATGKNLSLPALGYILLTASDRSLTIVATNLNLGLEISLAAKVERPGKALVSGAVLFNFLSNLHQDEKVKLEIVGNNLSVSTKTNSAVIKTYPLDDFPLISRLDTKNKFQLNSLKFINSCRAVAYAAAISDIKPEIASLYLYLDGKKLIFVGTDSFRLAEKTINLDSVP